METTNTAAAPAANARYSFVFVAHLPADLQVTTFTIWEEEIDPGEGFEEVADRAHDRAWDHACRVFAAAEDEIDVECVE